MPSSVVAHQLAGLAPRLDEVLTGEGEPLAVGIVGVEGHDGDARLQDAIDDRPERVARDRRYRQPVHLAHQRLDLADLVVGVGARGTDEDRVHLVRRAGLLDAGLDERGELVGDVMVGDIDVERLAGLDFRLDPIGEREVAELGCGIARERRHSDRRGEEDGSKFHCLSSLVGQF